MKRCLAAFPIAASLFTPFAAHAADNALMDKVRINAPIYALLSACDLRATGAAADHNAVLEGVKSDPEAKALLQRLHTETQAAYMKASKSGNGRAFCKDFIAANHQYAKARITAVAEGQMRANNDRVQRAIAHALCGAGDAPAKLSKDDRQSVAIIQQIFQTEHKAAKKDAEMRGRNVAESVADVTDQFCAGVSNR